ncbi:TD and POZ domain-containing protein 4-like [Argiope bruennichi]|nr:TD and POZ domain-containing protein 4-like [Argiope bruennichi]
MLEAYIDVLDAKGMVVRSNCFDGEFNIQKSKRQICVIEKSDLMSNAAVLLSDDVLLLECHLKFIHSFLVRNEIEAYKLMDYSESKAVQLGESEANFDKLNVISGCPFKEIVNEFKNDGILSDVCLRADNTSFPVHKLILSSRSPVFKAMFTKDMKEKTSKCIDIPDMDADTLHQLLFYIYENKLQKLTWEMAANLFEAADKYEILDLKEKCSTFLMDFLSVSNVCQTLVLADMHHDESLQKSAQDFILNNSEIIYSDRWKDFRQNYPKLALETTEQIIYNMKHPSC